MPLNVADILAVFFFEIFLYGEKSKSKNLKYEPPAAAFLTSISLNIELSASTFHLFWRPQAKIFTNKEVSRKFPWLKGAAGENF